MRSDADGHDHLRRPARAGGPSQVSKGKGPGRKAEAFPRVLDYGAAWGTTSRVTMFAGSLFVVTVKNGWNASPLCPSPT